MSTRSIALIALLLLSPIIIYFLWPTDESRIRTLFREGAGAVEKRKIEDVMSKVSFSYSDEHGLSYILIKDGITRLFSRMNNIKVDYEIRGLDIKDKTASAMLDVRVIATYDRDTGYIVGDAGSPVRIKFFLEKERARWLVIKTEGLPAGF